LVQQGKLQPQSNGAKIMPDKTLKVSDFEKALILTQQHAIIRILAFTFTYLFWLSLTLAALFLKLFGVVETDFFQNIPQWLQFLSLIGVTPIFLAILTWKIFDRLCSSYIKSYRDKHIKQKT